MPQQGAALTRAVGRLTNVAATAADLIQTNYADGTTTFATDGVANKLTRTDQMSQTTTYSYNVGGQILTVTNP